LGEERKKRDKKGKGKRRGKTKEEIAPL